MFSHEKKDNEVVMLEQQRTNDEEFHKPTPIVNKVDYSGAYEVGLLLGLDQEWPLLTSLENRPQGNRPCEEARPMDHAHAVVHVLA